DRLVGHEHVERLAVRLRVHGDGGDAELAAGPDDTHRDLAAVGDEDFLEGRGHNHRIIAGAYGRGNAGPRRRSSAELLQRLFQERRIYDVLDGQRLLHEPVLDPPRDLLLDVGDEEAAVAVLVWEAELDQLGLGPRVARGDLHHL